MIVERLRNNAAAIAALGRWIARLCLLLALAAPAGAQEPPDVSYTVALMPTGDARLDAAAEAVSQLVLLREPAPTSAFGLFGRAWGDLDRLRTALRSEGYYGGTVAITIAGEPVESPGLVARLERLAGPLAVQVALTPGPQYRVARIALTAEPSSAAAALAMATQEPLGIAEDDPARAEPVLDASERLLDRLRRHGHPLAALAEREVIVDHEHATMDLAWRIAPGPRARFAAPVVTGALHTDQAMLERIAARRLGGRDYSPDRLERARRTLLGLGPFSSVQAQPASALAPANELPVTFVVRERLFRAFGFNLAYETNFGPTARVYWEHRNLLGGAERLRLEGEVSRLGQDAGVRDMNYRAFVTYRTPEVFRRDIQMIARIGGVRERLEAYDRDVALVSLLFEHALSDTLVLQAGPGYEVGRVGRDGVWSAVNLASFTVGLRYDGTDSLLDPTRGWRATLAATPYLSLGEGANFTRIQAAASTYWNILGDGRSVLALRGSVASALGAARDDLPLDRRFYAGGGGSVRGFPYLGIGPRNAANRQLGGASLVEASVEWRQRIRGPWSMVAFVDAGSVGNASAPDLSDVRIGVGVGVRYLTTIGPLRLDLAVPVNPEPGGPGYGLYVGIGQAF